jgi:ABC-type lipoprotein export system ATPase subunit
MSHMWISRVRVTGGFLADTDIKFARGLNVVIGGRGAGKTTLLELIRHGLGLPYADERRHSATSEMVKAVLGSGTVILDLESEIESIRVTVDAEGGGRRSGVSDWALMVSQNEIESIASNPDARLNLLDLRARVVTTRQSMSTADGLTRELFEARRTSAELAEEIGQQVDLQKDLDSAKQREAALMSAVSTDVAELRVKLAKVEDSLAMARVNKDSALALLSRLEYASVSANSLLFALSALEDDSIPEGMREAVGEVTKKASSNVESVASSLVALTQKVLDLRQDSELQDLLARAEAEPIRASLEQTEKGLGEVTAELQSLRTKLARVEVLRVQLTGLHARIKELAAARAKAFLEAETEGEQLYLQRQTTASNVSVGLTDRVVVTVNHLADTREFLEVMAGAMKGSSLQYRGLIETIAGRILPTGLLEMVENGLTAELADAAGINAERAARFIEHFDREDSLANLSRARLDDKVDFWLMEKGVQKSVDQLSTGQKCAVTLPLLLSEHSRTLILDQPEDHLDNAYLVDNIVDSLDRRAAASAQTIVATHNPNIPVLGDAELVIGLESDGLQGRVTASGRFDDDPIVDRITSLMEGGIAAFERRAKFYREHGQKVE